MATRSAIAIKHGRNTIKSVYCHWDGYPEHNGRILEEYYTTPFIVNELINMGPISSLGATIGKKVEFDATPEYIQNDFEMAISYQCVFYNRDRGENTSFRTFKTEADFVEHYDNVGAEYYYLFDNGVWYVRNWSRDVEWKEVESLLTKQKETA